MLFKPRRSAAAGAIAAVVFGVFALAFLVPFPQHFTQEFYSAPLSTAKVNTGPPGSVSTSGSWAALGIVAFVIASANGTVLYSVTGIGGNFSIGYGGGSLFVWAISVTPAVVYVNGTAWAPAVPTGLP